MASTDVHEFAKFLLSRAGRSRCRVIDFGVNRDPEDIVNVGGGERRAGHRGHHAQWRRRSFAQVLRKETGVRRRLGAMPVYMGGVLNEDIEGSEIPVDVRGDLRRSAWPRSPPSRS